MGLKFTHIPDNGFVPGLLEKMSAQIPNFSCSLSSTLKANLKSSGVSKQQIYWCHFLCTLVHIIANNEFDILSKDAFHILSGNQILEVLLTLGIAMSNLNPETVGIIFRDGSKALRRVWDNILNTLEERILSFTWPRIENKDMYVAFFLNFFEIVQNFHQEWIFDAGNGPSIMSAALGRPELAKKLLIHHRYGNEPLHDRRIFLLKAIRLATASGAFESVKYLVSYFSLEDQDDTSFDMLSYLLGHILVELAVGHHDEVDEQRMLQTIHILLDFGADPDESFDYDGLEKLPEYQNHQLSFWRSIWSVHWRLSILDASFYSCNQSFELLQKSSETFRNPESMSRSRICKALEQGHEALDDYLASLTAYSAKEKQDFLELMLLEQFGFLPHRRGATLNKIHASIARGLFAYGVTCSASEEIATRMLSSWVCSVEEYGLNDDLQFLLTRLAEERPTITELMFAEMIEDRGVKILNMMDEVGIWNKRYAGIAQGLSQATQRNNYEAVDWLIAQGVDVNSTCAWFPSSKETILSICLEGRMSRGMFWHLIKDKPKLRRTSEDKNCAGIFEQLLRRSSREQLAEVLEFFQNYSTEVDSFTATEWAGILAAILMMRDGDKTVDRRTESYYWQTFDQLARQRYVKGSGGRVLHYAIEAGCSQQIAEMLVELGADLNEEGFWDSGNPLSTAVRMGDLKLAQWLHEQGAAIDNSVLVNACRMQLGEYHEEEGQDKMAFIRFLVRNGADVNGQDEAFGRPLKAAIFVRDFTLIHWLLEQGAFVDAGAMEEACLRRGFGCEKRQQSKLGLLQLLVENGADINGTPLLRCAKGGDVEAASFFLKQQADPNLAFEFLDKGFISRDSRIRHYEIKTALDAAADSGRLDTVQLLLKAGGLSGYPGKTGYHGALKIARRKKNSATVELIRQHICSNKESFKLWPKAQSNHQATINAAWESWVRDFEKKRGNHGYFCKEFSKEMYCCCVVDRI